VVLARIVAGAASVGLDVVWI